MSEEVKSHLFAVRTTGGQEKIVMNLLETRAKMNKIDIQAVLLVEDLKGYVVVEALDPSAAFLAIEGIRHIRGQLRGELEYKDIEGYLVKKSTVKELSVDAIVEITGGRSRSRCPDPPRLRARPPSARAGCPSGTACASA